MRVCPVHAGTKLAAQRLGIQLRDMKPRAPQSFREGPTDNAETIQIK